MTEYVIRQIHPPGMSALGHEATAVNLVSAVLKANDTSVVLGEFYLEWADPDARGGRGDQRWTDDLSKAKRFEKREQAFAFWRARSKLHPTRLSDGKPNRPLTAFSVSIEAVP